MARFSYEHSPKINELLDKVPPEHITEAMANLHRAALESTLRGRITTTSGGLVVRGLFLAGNSDGAVKCAAICNVKASHVKIKLATERWK